MTVFLYPNNERVNVEIKAAVSVYTCFKEKGMSARTWEHVCMTVVPEKHTVLMKDARNSYVHGSHAPHAS